MLKKAEEGCAVGPARRMASRGVAQPCRITVVKLPDVKRGFVLLPRRWMVERSFAWMARFRRLARAYERPPEPRAGLPFLAVAPLMLSRVIHLALPSACQALGAYLPRFGRLEASDEADVISEHGARMGDEGLCLSACEAPMEQSRPWR